MKAVSPSAPPRSSDPMKAGSPSAPPRSSDPMKAGSPSAPRRSSDLKFGVVRFPGSCDDVDALLAARRIGEAVLLWHAEPDLRGVDAVIIPGGFSYGDYLRVGAIARFAPVMAE